MKHIVLLLLTLATLPAVGQRNVSPGQIDASVHELMVKTGSQGLAVAYVDGGKVRYSQAYGVRNAKGDPLTPDTVMYGASLTKAVVAYTALQLFDQHRLNLDQPIAAVLEQSLPTYGPDPVFPNKYGPYKDLAGDDRWKLITPRMCLTHSTGFANFAYLEPDHKLRIHSDPGKHYSYSGEGFILLQFAIEHGRLSQGLGTDLGELTQKVFNSLAMSRTSLVWRPDFAANLADGFDDAGVAHPHDQRSKVRAAGSMDTTITDFATFAAALVRGTGLSAASIMELIRPQLHIDTAHQFPTFLPVLAQEQQRKDLSAGLGVVTFDGPQGRGFYKGGHDEQTGNTLVCIEKRQRCVLILSNDVRSEAGYAKLVRDLLGETGVPFDWEYGEIAGKS